MEKVSITVDVMRLDKNQIKERRYTDSKGHEVVAKDLKLDVVPLREPKVIKEGEGWQLIKTHFVAEQQTKEQKDKKEKSKIVGSGVMFKDTKVVPVPATSHEDIDLNSIPF